MGGGDRPQVPIYVIKDCRGYPYSPQILKLWNCFALDNYVDKLSNFSLYWKFLSCSDEIFNSDLI